MLRSDHITIFLYSFSEGRGRRVPKAYTPHQGEARGPQELVGDWNTSREPCILRTGCSPLGAGDGGDDGGYEGGNDGGYEGGNDSDGDEEGGDDGCGGDDDAGEMGAQHQF